MRRIVTANRDGRSAILSRAPLREAPLEVLWRATPEAPLGRPPSAQDAPPPFLPPGDVAWVMVALPPEVVMRDLLRQGVPGHDAEGFHRTATVDYVMVLDGPVTLVLDEEEVELEPGDLVVQRDTNHAWRNGGEMPVRLLCLMIGVPR